MEKREKSTLRKTISWTLRGIGVAALLFVAYNLYIDRNTIKVNQDSAPSVEQVKTALETDNTQEGTDIIAPTVRRGSFSGANGYSASGGVLATEVDGQPVIKFEEDFNSTPGPDLKVYLSKNKAQSGEGLGEFVSLEALRSTSGAQVYAAPENIDDFQSVVIWCRAFSVSFGAADLN